MLGQAADEVGQGNLEEVTVTGTRVARDGFEAPTPLTVVGSEQIESAARPNIADMVNTLPAFAGGLTPHSGGADVSSGRQGQNNLNLRGLGVNRTLTLLDGQRIVSGDTSGAVNINDFPQALVSRVEIVTGGASAAYGSDALSGVVNFVLDKEFTGMKSTVEGGMTSRGDNETYRLSLTMGAPWASDRGHFLISGEYNKVEGILGIPRRWNKNAWRIMQNPAYTSTNGRPFYLVRQGVGLTTATPGGIIVDTPLRGVHFAADGTPLQFNYGPLVRDPFMQGGDWQYSDASQEGALDNPLLRRSLYMRASFELTENIEVFGQFIYGYSSAYGQATTMFNLGGLVIQRDNAFLPESIRQQMFDLNLTQFRMGTLNPDLPHLSTLNDRTMRSYAVGATGEFGAFGSDWTWDVYVQKGFSHSLLSAEAFITARLNAANDAVRDSNGAIVCRSTLTSPGSGCVPYNSFGIGVNSQDAINWVVGRSTLNQRVVEDVAAVGMRGEPFSLWAGPVSLALGAEYRKESVSGSVDPLSQASAYLAGNYKATHGSFDVKEAYLETVIPLAKDSAFAEALDFNGAVRATEYSTSGFVTTWKVGLTYSPFSDLRFRATRSRDIRAPNLNDAFLAGTGTSQPGLLDPFNNNQVIPTLLANTIGNPDLEPEKADTLGIGVVYQPSWLSGLSTSVDLYDIEVQGAIGNIGTQETLDRCFMGNQELCSRITRNSQGVITQITLSPYNLLTEKTRGVDIEASYRTLLNSFVSSWEGDLTLRALGTHAMELTRDDGRVAAIDLAGQNANSGPVKWRWLLSASYGNDPLNVTLSGRYLSGGKYDNSWIECTSGCPASTVTRRTIDSNDIDGAFYVDLAVNYSFADLSDSLDVEAFLSVQDLMDKDPPVVANTNHYSQSANPNLYDVLGRQYRAGVRIRW